MVCYPALQGDIPLHTCVKIGFLLCLCGVLRELSVQNRVLSDYLLALCIC